MAYTPIISRVVINSAGATVGIGANISTISYTDEFGVGTSHCEFDLAKTATIRPKVGDFILIEFKYAEDVAAAIISTGTMRVDDVVYKHHTQTLSVGMIGFDYNSGAFSQDTTTFAYSNATIRNIVATQATALGLTFANSANVSTAIAGVGNTATDAKIFKANSRAGIIEKVARDYGYYCKVKAGALTFIDQLDVESANPLFSLVPELTARDVEPQTRISTDGVYKTIRLNYSNGSAIINGTLDDQYANTNKTKDIRPEGVYASVDAASRRSYGEIREQNKNQHRCSVSVEGNWIYETGVVINLSGFASEANGKYVIESCIHTIRRSDGWRTQLDLRRVFLI